MRSLIFENTVSTSFLISNCNTHKGVAPVIATLLLVAISSVGGSSVFMVSQNSFDNAQVSGSTIVEQLKLLDTMEEMLKN